MNHPEYPKPFDPTKATIGAMYWTRNKSRQLKFIALSKRDAVFENDIGGILVTKRDGRIWSNEDNDDDIVLYWEDDIAEGHNPARLTNSQVGEGYRLLENGEFLHDNAETWTELGWQKTVPAHTNVGTYRVPLDLPKKRVPLDASDFPLGKLNYVRQNGRSTVFLVTGSWPGGIKYEQAFVDFSCLKKAYEYTTDNGVTWRPCWKEV